MTCYITLYNRSQESISRSSLSFLSNSFYFLVACCHSAVIIIMTEKQQQQQQQEKKETFQCHQCIPKSTLLIPSQKPLPSCQNIHF